MTVPAFPPIGEPEAPGPPRVQPYHLRQRQDFAIEQERQRHADALYRVGEWVIFFLLWHIAEFERGLVARCSRCYATGKDARIAEVYQQPTQNRCPVCFGTTFEGGYRARIVRPAIFADTDAAERQDRKGLVHPDSVSIESTWDFQIRNGDIAVRADNSRWRLRVPSRTTLRSGFDFPGQAETSLTYSRIQGDLEEAGTVAYDLPPTDPVEVEHTLTQPSRTPLDFGVFEQIRGPLIPDPYLVQE